MTLKAEDAGGVVPLLFLVSAYAALLRGSNCIEPRDLIKAIYIVDLEHVAAFWDEWEGFERVVCRESSAAGISEGYINRTVYLIRAEKMASETAAMTQCGSPSRTFQRIVASARKVASERVGAPVTPSSRDLLLCACSIDRDLSRALQESGLRLDKLAEAVKKPHS